MKWKWNKRCHSVRPALVEELFISNESPDAAAEGVFAIRSADDKKSAAGIVSAIASGLVGFLVGQAQR